jgi:hypothetical protein
MAIALVAYVGVFLLVEPMLGASAGVFSALPVVIVGGLFGPEAGLVGAVLSLAVTYALWSATGHEIGEPVVLLGQGSGAVMILLLGFSAGALRIIGVRLDPRRRRAEAIAEAARAMSGIDRSEFVDAYLDGLLRVAQADRALLFLNAAGDARMVASSRGAGGVYPDRIAPLAREVMRAVAPRTIDVLPEEQRFSPDLRSAVLVPISVAGEEVRGALVVLRRDRAFTAEEVALISPFAQFLWLLLRTGPIAPTVAANARAKEQSV